MKYRLIEIHTYNKQEIFTLNGKKWSSVKQAKKKIDNAYLAIQKSLKK